MNNIILIELYRSFIGHDGYSMMNNTGFYFANKFDWVMMNDKIIKKTIHPRHIYVKIDYLRKYFNDIINIKNDFILITGCGDESPQITYKEEYLQLVNHPHLTKWYAENNLSTHPKMHSLTVGFATHTKQYEDNLLSIRENIIINNKMNKIFCCWRKRDNNCCGNEFIERGNMTNFIHTYPDKFDCYNDCLSDINFQKNLSKYKWCLCPLGNGVDCAPKIVECFFFKNNSNSKEKY